MSASVLIMTGLHPHQYRVINSESKMLAGLITYDAHAGKWLIDMFMCIQSVASTKEEAVAFVHGVAAAAEMWGPLRPPAKVSPLPLHMAPKSTS